MSRAIHSPGNLVGVMNDTKWEELRLAMYGLGPLHPQFQVKDLESHEPSTWDGEWFYHFRLLPYSTIEWCDLRICSEEQRLAVLECLRAIRLPGESTANGFHIHGWIRTDQTVSYIE